MERRKSFVFYAEWAETIADYPSDVRLEIYEAAIRYAVSRETVELRPLARMAFGFIKKDIDRNNSKFDEYRSKQQENGRKGGAPKGNRNASRKTTQTTQTTQRLKNNPEQPKTTQTTLNENVNENENDITAVSSLRSETALSETGSDAEAGGGHDFGAFERFFNSELERAGSQMPRLHTMSARRRAALNARCKEHGREAVAKAVRKAARSKFLNGGGSKQFVATFDWLMRPNNFPKVLDGNYDDNISATTNQIQHGSTANWQGDQAAAKRQRDEEFARHIAEKLGGDSLH